MHIKYYLFLGIMVLFLFVSCANNDYTVKEVDKTLLKSENVKIYDVDIDKLLKSDNIYRKLHEFPFISDDANLDFKGHFPVEFYQSFNFDVKAAELKSVDFWKLRDYPYILDVIYIKPIWLDNFKYVSNDLFEDICYSYNLSKKQQSILLWWLKNGGILWVESGIYATGFENIKRDGSINLKAIKRRMLRLTNNLHFLEYPINCATYISRTNSLTSMKQRIIEFDNVIINRKFLKEIKKLKLKLKYPVQTFFNISAKGVIESSKGLPLVNIMHYHEGKIIFLYPFDYLDAYKDGELLRWRLLQYIYTYPHYSSPGPKFPEEKKVFKGERLINNNSLRDRNKCPSISDNISKKDYKCGPASMKTFEKKKKKKKKKKIKKIEKLI